MNKVLKVMLIFLVIFVVGFMGLVILGDNDRKKEEELAKEVIGKELAFDKNIIEYYATQRDLLKKSVYEKHVRVTGIVDKVETWGITLSHEDFVIECYTDELNSGIEADGMVALHGVCTYLDESKMRLRMCTIINVEDNVEKAVIEMSPNAEIEAIVGRNIGLLSHSYLYKDNNYVIKDIMQGREELPSEDLSSRVAQAKKENGCNTEDGYLVFLKEESTPAFFVEKDTYKIFTLRCSMENSNEYICYPFINDEMIATYCELLKEVKKQWIAYSDEILNAQYTIAGRIVDVDYGDNILYIQGTASRNDGQGFYNGGISLSYNENELIDETADSISIGGYYMGQEIDEDIPVDEWLEDINGYKMFNSVKSSPLGVTREMGIPSWIEEVDRSLEILNVTGTLSVDENLQMEDHAAEFVGEWWDVNSQRCYMTIDSADGVNYNIDINWSNGAEDNTHWVFAATYDSDSNGLVYNGSRCEEHYSVGGDMQETYVYTDGEGVLKLDDNGKLYWNDLVENAGKDCVFEKN